MVSMVVQPGVGESRGRCFQSKIEGKKNAEHNE